MSVAGGRVWRRALQAGRTCFSPSLFDAIKRACDNQYMQQYQAARTKKCFVVARWDLRKHKVNM